MSSLKIYYLPFPFYNQKGEKVGEIFRPFIQIRLGYKHNLAKFLIDCLIDSGSDFNLFPAQWGEAVGISIKKGKPSSIKGIGSSQLMAYRHTVNLFAGTHKLTVEADFSYEQNTPLLGRNGFFNHFKSVDFNEKARYVELEGLTSS